MLAVQRPGAGRRAPQGTTGAGRRAGTVGDHGFAVHQHPVDPGGLPRAAVRGLLEVLRTNVEWEN